MRVFKWRRVGGTVTQLVSTSLFTALGAAATLGMLYLLITDVVRGRLQTLPFMIFVVLFLTAWTALAFRMGRIGVFVNETGVRNRALFRTRTIAWADVNRFDIRPMTKGLGSEYAEMLRVNAIWIILADGDRIQTSLAFRDKSRFLAAKGVAKIVDTFAGPATSFGEQTGMALSNEGAQQALRELRAAHEAARG